MPHLPLCTKFPPSQSPSAYLYWVNHSRCVNSLLDYGHNPKIREFNTHITGYCSTLFQAHDLKKTYLNRIKGAPLSSVERKHYEVPLQHRHVYLSLSLSLSPFTRGSSMRRDLEGALAVKVADSPTIHQGVSVKIIFASPN